jgi:transposase
MKKKFIIGIDVSKSTLDVYVQDYQVHFIVTNDSMGVIELLEKLKNIFGSLKKEQLLICFENTGKYSKFLSVFLSSEHIPFVMLSALDLKRSMGLTRGKNDKKDAMMIALYAYRKKEELIPTILQDAKTDQMKSLLSLREKLIRHRTAYKNGLTDLKDCYVDGETEMIKQIQERLIENINTEIDRIEQKILTIIVSEESINRNYKLAISVKSVGKILAFYVIAYTANFTRFDDPRKFACFSGTAPFDFTSGTSIKGKTRVHNCANKQIKSILNMAAISATRVKGEYKNYYQRRINEMGKSKMSTINIIRNKLIFRIFAVVKRGTPYVDLQKYAA